jgi:hypothetical protein
VILSGLLACSASTRPPPASDVDTADGGAAEAGASSPGAGGSATGDPGTGGPGTGSTPELAPRTWCSGRTTLLCDDFDTPAVTSALWSASDTTGALGAGLPAGALGAIFASAPNAFVAKTPAIAGTTTERVQIQSGGRGPDATSADAVLTFSVRIGTLGDASRIEIARIEGVNPITFASYGVALLVSKAGASIELTQGSNAKVTRGLSAAPRPSAWSRIAIHLGLERTVTGPPASFDVTIDAAPPETFAIERGMGVLPFFRFGLETSGPSTPCEVAFDDVTYDAR